MFRNLFLVLVPTSDHTADHTVDPAARVTHEDDLSSTVIVPVPSAAAAVSVVAGFGEVDLIELYGGLGIDAAAAVVEAAPGVPVGFAGDVAPAAVAVLFEDPAPGRWTFGRSVVVTVPSPADAPAVAAALAPEVARIELCGGMGPVAAAAVRSAVDVPVTTVLFGVESLPAAAAYRERFEAALRSAEPPPLTPSLPRH